MNAPSSITKTTLVTEERDENSASTITTKIVQLKQKMIREGAKNLKENKTS